MSKNSTSKEFLEQITKKLKHVGSKIDKTSVHRMIKLI